MRTSKTSECQRQGRHHVIQTWNLTHFLDLTIFLLRWLTVQICFVLPAIFAEYINRLLSHLGMRQCEMFCIVETVVVSVIIEI